MEITTAAETVLASSLLMHRMQENKATVTVTHYVLDYLIETDFEVGYSCMTAMKRSSHLHLSHLGSKALPDHYASYEYEDETSVGDIKSYSVQILDAYHNKAQWK